MTMQVPWNKIIMEEFIEIGALTEDEEQILRTRCAGWSQQKQALYFGLSLSTVNRITKRLKIKYDRCQPFSVLLPPRERCGVWRCK